MKIIPTILEKTAQGLIKQLTRLRPYFNHFQIDIADGIFVPNKTIQIDNIINLFPNNQYLITNNINFDFHLMIQDYEKEIDKLKQFNNIKNILIHASVFPNNQYQITNNIGLVLNPEDSVKSLKNNFDLNKIPVIQIMTINPGFQGSPFIPETLKKVEQLRLADYRNKIYLDGGLNQATIKTVISQKYLADGLCIGSYLTKTNNLNDNINFLKSILKE